MPLLVGLGVSELSVNPPAIPATKEAVRQVDAGEPRCSPRGAGLASADDVRALVAGEAPKPSESFDTVSGSVLLGLTYLRILLIPVVMGLILLGPDRDWAYVAAAILFASRPTTDFVDGYLAGGGPSRPRSAPPRHDRRQAARLRRADRPRRRRRGLRLGRDHHHRARAPDPRAQGVVAAEGTVFAPSIWGKLKTNVQFVAILLAILRYDEPLGRCSWTSGRCWRRPRSVLSAVEYLARFGSALSEGSS